MIKLGHTPIQRYRAYEGPAILRQGFRPFFLLASGWAILTVLLTIAAYASNVRLPSVLPPTSWHFHEMIFGYVMAAIAGFLLTAIPNWTGRLPIQGLPLLGLVLLWGIGRVANMTSGVIGAEFAAFLDLTFPVALGAVCLREIVAARNWRNLPVVLIIYMLAVCNGLSHAEAMMESFPDGLSRRLSIAVVISLISLIGGRIIPGFTRNWLVKEGATRLPEGFGAFDRVALVLTLVALGFWVAVPGHVESSVLLGLAGVAQLLRLARWSGLSTGREPLLWVLHVGYFWIPVGFLLLSAGRWVPSLSEITALHALTAGAMGTMTIGVMSRATMGHTGSPLHAGGVLTAAYALVALSAAVRISSVYWEGQYLSALHLSAVLWILAFAAFLTACAPMLLSRRPH